MKLRHIEPGIKMVLRPEQDSLEAGRTFEAVYRYHENDSHFVVKCPALYDEIKAPVDKSNTLHISFEIGPYIYTFHGRVAEKQRNTGMLMIEQRTELKKINRRLYERDELRLHIRIKGLPAAMINESRHHKMDSQPDMIEMTFDVSTGGLCVISQKMLKSEHDPYYLLEFSINDRDSFLLPAKLVRRSNYPRTRIGKYEYGFQFIFDKHPDDKGRLTSAILNKKLSYL